MENITKDYLLNDFRHNIRIGLNRSKSGDLIGTAMSFGKVKFIKDLLLRAFDYDIEKDTKLLSLYTELFYSF